MVLTGRMMDAAEAERAGLVSRVIPAADLVDEAVKVATVIAAMPPLAVLANKEMVNAAFETNLTQGVQFERRLFNGLFATQDQKRSEEHTSELQSLMRLSYAVFFLKKQNLYLFFFSTT